MGPGTRGVKGTHSRLSEGVSGLQVNGGGALTRRGPPQLMGLPLYLRFAPRLFVAVNFTPPFQNDSPFNYRLFSVGVSL